ncbi:MAG: hypothetical protein Q9213_004742 [Squamulea squamosa]
MAESDAGNVSFAWTVGDRHYTVTDWPPTPGQPAPRFIKRQLKAHERFMYKDGTPALGIFNLDRLKHEKNALKLIAKHTTVPVPRVLDWSIDEDGVASLTMEVIGGRNAHELLYSGLLTDDDTTTLKSNVEFFMSETVLPQLSKLRSNLLGQLARVLFVPPRLEYIDTESPNGVRAGPAKYADTPCFHFTHNDLGLQNMHVDNSLKVIGLLDGEYAAFCPKGFEVPYWRYSMDEILAWDRDPTQAMMSSRDLLEEARLATSFSLPLAMRQMRPVRSWPGTFHTPAPKTCFHSASPRHEQAPSILPDTRTASLDTSHPVRCAQRKDVEARVHMSGGVQQDEPGDTLTWAERDSMPVTEWSMSLIHVSKRRIRAVVESGEEAGIFTCWTLHRIRWRIRILIERNAFLDAICECLTLTGVVQRGAEVIGL